MELNIFNLKALQWIYIYDKKDMRKIVMDPEKHKILIAIKWWLSVFLCFSGGIYFWNN